jgi:ribonuclease HII
MKPSKLELELLKDKKFQPVAGVDEVAVCCYAGPVYAAAVILDYNFKYSELIRDCKTLRDGQLKEAYKEVIQKARVWSVAKATVREIDAKGTSWAIDQAMKRAVKGLSLKPNCLLIDFRNLSGIHCWQLAEIDADQKYLCVAAASIIAKYHHDQEMLRLDKRYPQYNWLHNKGVFTKDHEERIIKYGLSPHHRTSWCQAIERRRRIKLKIFQSD